MRDAQDWLTFALAVGAVVSLVAGWLKVIRPRYRKVRKRLVGAWDSVFGREAIIDTTTGREIEPALPGVGMRLATQEEHLANQGRDLSVLTEAVATIAKSHARLDVHEDRLDAHEQEIALLKAGSMERIVSRVESVAAFRAMEEAIKAEPDTTLEPDRPDPPDAA